MVFNVRHRNQPVAFGFGIYTDYRRYIRLNSLWLDDSWYLSLGKRIDWT